MKYLRKILLNKVRSHLKEVRANAWTYYNYRQQKSMRSNLQLFKVLSIIQDKMKLNKFHAMSKLKEVFYSLEKQDSGMKSTSCVKDCHTSSTAA